MAKGYSDDIIYDGKATLVSITSSDKKVIKVVKDGTDKTLYAGYYLEPRKKGTSVITLTYNYKGKEYTTSRELTVKNYPKPYKKIVVNGKNVKLSKNKYYYAVNKFKKTSAKVKLTPASGWKISNAYLAYYNEKDDKFKDLKKKTLLKGNSFKIPKGYNGQVGITMKNKKTGDTIDYVVNFFR